MALQLTGLQEIDQIQSPYYQAFKRMEDNKPKVSKGVIKSLQAQFFKERTDEFLTWRGWMGAIGGRFCITNWMAIPNDVDLDDIGYVGVLRGQTRSKTHVLYCILPSMNHGEVLAWSTVDLGSERIRIGWKQEDLDAMVRQGYEIMMQMIAERGEYREE
jgi:hypothetical protein